MDAAGLDRLTDREKRVLRLLASGHSVKSAAVEEAVSENAANELLRSARRKLGTGSSREAARLLAGREAAPQKNRDEKVVVPNPSPEAAIFASMDTGTIAMLAAALAASANSPKVVGTEPTDGAEIVSAPFTLSVSFDRAMAPDSYSFVRNTDEGAFPDCALPPRLSPDRRTYSLECAAPPPGKYVIYFNRPPYMAFRDAASGAPAQPHRLEFTVGDR